MNEFRTLFFIFHIIYTNMRKQRNVRKRLNNKRFFIYLFALLSQVLILIFSEILICETSYQVAGNTTLVVVCLFALLFYC